MTRIENECKHCESILSSSCTESIFRAKINENNGKDVFAVTLISPYRIYGIFIIHLTLCRPK